MKPAEGLDRRVFGRRKTDIRAQVRVGYRVIPCTVKDVSEGGALLEFDQAVELPVRLWLSWAEQAEIVCEVRHQRRNLAGVQFSRPQALTLRPTSLPSEPLVAPALVAPKPAEPSAPVTTGAALIAGMRRAIRQPLTAPAPAKVATGPKVPLAPTPQPPEPPRDISGLMQSLKAAAERIVEARAAASVPRPLPPASYGRRPILPAPGALPVRCPAPCPAAAYAGAAVLPPAVAATPGGPTPLPAAAYAGSAEDPSGLVAPHVMVRPMAAATCAGVPVLAPAMAVPDTAPGPLPPSKYPFPSRQLAPFEGRPAA